MTGLQIWILCSGCFSVGFVAGGLTVILGNRKRS
jgi:hypothetical protein